MSITSTSTDQQLIDWLISLLSEVEDIYLRKPFALDCVSEQLNEAFGIDSFGKVNLFYAIIDDLSLDLPETSAENWLTLQDLLAFIKQNAPGT